MSFHSLKTDKDPFDATRRGNKPFELRKDDRPGGYRVADVLILKETKHTGAEMAAGAPLVYTGDQLRRRVTYVLRGPAYGLPAGWVVMAHEPLGRG